MKITSKPQLFLFLIVVFLFSCNQSKKNDTATEIKNDSVETNNKVIVTAKNFNKAETDMYFSRSVKEAGGIGRFHHFKELMPIDNQTVIRANRDVLYSSIVFDLDTGPVTITLPNPGKRFMSMQVIDEEQYSKTEYAPCSITYTKDKIGTRYVMIALRIFIDPNDPKDLKKATDLQEAVKINQKNKGSFEIPNWDQVSQKKVRDSLIEASKKLPDSKGMFGGRGEVDETRHLIGSATGWGGNPKKDAFYVTVTPPKNDGKTVHTLSVKDVPVDGFWSISVYNKEGYFQKNNLNSYSINNLTAKKEADGSVKIQFGGCDGKISNCIPVMDGWNYWVRLYRPRKEILNDGWKFPELQVVKK